MKKKQWKSYLEFGILKLFLFFLKLFPLWLVSSFFFLLLKALLVLPFMKNYLKIVTVNLKLRFAGEKITKTDQEINQLAHQVLLKNLSLSLFFLRSLSIKKKTFAALCKTSGSETIEKHLTHSGDLLLAASHYSNFLFPLYYLSWIKKLPCTLVLRRIENPLIHQYVEKELRKKGIRCVIKNYFIKELLQRSRAKPRRLEKTNQVYFVLIDQNSAVSGRFVPFFNTLAAVQRTPWFIKEKVGCEVCYTYAKELSKTKAKTKTNEGSFFPYELHYSKPLTENSEAALLKALSRKLEALIKQDVLQYLWVHPKWKKRPETEPAAKNPYRHLSV